MRPGDPEGAASAPSRDQLAALRSRLLAISRLVRSLPESAAPLGAEAAEYRFLTRSHVDEATLARAAELARRTGTQSP